MQCSLLPTFRIAARPFRFGNRQPTAPTLENVPAQNAMLNREKLRALGAWFKRMDGKDTTLAAIVLIFLVGLLPMVATKVFDIRHAEQYYTDGAILMQQNHDFLTPRESDGSARFRKPPLIYWIIAGSYSLLGVSFFSSRIPFLLIGCATIWLAYRLTLRLTNDIGAARTTALILLSQPLFLLLSVNAAPDIPLAFCMLLSANGFIRLICQNDTATSSYWSAYGGAAAGAAIKGLFPVVFVAYTLIFAYFTSSREQPFRRVFNFRIVLVCLLIACSQFLLMWWRHGWIFFQVFWGDQAGSEIDMSRGLVRFGTYWAAFSALYVLLLLPWLLCLGYLFYNQKPEKSLTVSQRRTCVFVLIWAALIPLIFCLGLMIEVRYLLHSTLLLAVIIAMELRRFSSSTTAVLFDRLLKVVVVAFWATAALGLSLLWQTDFLTKHYAGFLIVFLALLAVAIWWLRNQLSPQTAFAFALFLFLPLIQTVASVFTLPAQVSQVASMLRSANTANRPVHAIGPRRELASQLRIASAAKYVVCEATVADLLNEQTSPATTRSIFVWTESMAQGLSTDSLQFCEVASGFEGISPLRLFLATLRGNAKAYLENRKRHCYAVFPDSSLNQQSERE
jgi:4-amino-4-deoxy-L-arabinose transferase-like glycosyltransferase